MQEYIEEVLLSSKVIEKAVTFVLRNMWEAQERKVLFLFFTLLQLSVSFVVGRPARYKPVVVVHGLFSNAKKMMDLKDMILKAHPGTQVTSLNLYPGVRSLEPLGGQIAAIKKRIAGISSQSPEGIHLICHSQGGLLCKAVVEDLADHNVHSLILLGTPFVGQFGIPATIIFYLPFLTGEREALTRYMYTSIAQRTLSFANYWRDPRSEYQEEYVSDCRILPHLNNNPNAFGYNATAAEQKKRNFLKLRRVVLVGGSGDKIIIPWQSSIGGFYDDKYKIGHFTEQISFKEDWYGLRSLYERDSLHVYAIPGVSHSDWHKDKHVFSTAIEKYLD